MKHAAALPIGIGLVGFGAVLLFIAFHSLPPQVKTFQDLLAHLQADLVKGSAG